MKNQCSMRRRTCESRREKGNVMTAENTVAQTTPTYTKKTRMLAALGLMTTALIWGSTFPAGKYALQYMSPFYLMGFRFMLAFIIGLILFRKVMFSTPLSGMTGGMLAGLAQFGGYILQIYGLQFTTAGKQSFLAGAYVIMVPFLTWLVFKKSPPFKAYVGTAICLWGISLISLSDNLTIGLGDSLTLISSALYGVHIVVTGYFAHKQDAGVFTTVQFGVGGVLALIMAAIFSPLPTMELNGGVFSVIYLAVFGSFVAYYLQTVCQKYVKPSVTSIILSMEAVFGSLLSVLLLSEPFTMKMAIGAAAILVAIWVSEL